MKISINKVKQVPGLAGYFGVCVYGPLPEDVQKWVDYHGFRVSTLNGFTNIEVDRDPFDIFLMLGVEGLPNVKYKYMDGFSPNLNKELHIGHLSNLVYAKAFKKLGVTELTVAILGDTLEGDVSNEDGLENFDILTDLFGYEVNMKLFASEMELDDSMLVPGTGDYEGTQVFEIGDDKMVGVKSDGSTTYFYQDVALAAKLSAPTLYLTGSEQNEHFGMLKEKYPDIHHVGLGLVKAKGQKMSSRKGNVILIDDFMELLDEPFDSYKLSYNVMAGFILRTAPGASKNIDLDAAANPKTSPGLYLSYTLARLKSAGIKMVDMGRFTSKELQFKYMQARESLMPNWFFNELVDHAKKINGLYEEHQIRGNAENTEMFTELGNDLLKGMKRIGLFEIDSVPKR